MIVCMGSSLELHVILTYSRVSCQFDVCVDRFICEEKKSFKKSTCMARNWRQALDHNHMR